MKQYIEDNSEKSADELLCDIAALLRVYCLSDLMALRNTNAFKTAVQKICINDYSLAAWVEAADYICKSHFSNLTSKSEARDLMMNI